MINLNNLKRKVDKLDVDKLVHVAVDLSKLSDVVKNDIVKKDAYDAKIKILKIKYLILPTEILLLLLLILKIKYIMFVT